jgi:DNA-binding beta-propeller fold protein YncE
MNKPEFGNYNNSLWEKLFNNVECEQITKYYSNWTSNIDIDKECINTQKKIRNVETFLNQINVIDLVVKDDTIITVNYLDSNVTIIKDKKPIMGITGGSTGKYFKNPSGIAIRKDGVIIIADSGNNRICSIKDRRVDVIVSGTFELTDELGIKEQFNNPYGVAIHPNGNIIVVDTDNNCIRSIDADYKVTTIAGNSKDRTVDYRDGKGTHSRFKNPSGIAIMKDHTIIVADSGNNCIRSIDKDYMVRTIAGSIKGFKDGNGTDALFNNPIGVAIMDDQTIFVTDCDNHCIRSINIEYYVITIAGSICSHMSCYRDGLGPIAKFSYPRGITIAPDNSILIADFLNKKIRRLYYK